MNQSTPEPTPVPISNAGKPDIQKILSQQGVSGYRLEASAFKGPVPPPEVIREYEQILPGLADRIFKMAEDQSAHRRAMETKEVNSINFRALLGLVFAFIIILVVILVGAYLIYNDHPITGLVAMLSASVYIVYNFITGKKAEAPSKSKS